MDANTIGRPDDLFDRQRRTTSRVAVELREDHPVEVERLVEGLCGRYRVLPGHGVDDEERVMGRDRLAHAPHLVHQVGVYCKASGRVDDENIPTDAAGLGQPLCPRRRPDPSAR